MSNLGLGVMLGLLGSNETTVNAIKQSLGKEIKSILLQDERLSITLSDDSTLHLYDDGQSCCENRYMQTDDDLDYYVGSELLNIELKDSHYQDNDYEVHEVQFLDITTRKGVFQIANHNEHNGYYGGFLIKAYLTEK